jgi:hypothetical protein
VPIAKVLGIHVEDLLTDEKPKKRRGGLVGKLQRVFDEVASLPRRQQEKIIEFVGALLNQYSDKISSRKSGTRPREPRPHGCLRPTTTKSVRRSTRTESCG